ncbi:hypothetical protein [Nocardioides humi]|uniref:hypothetical protein n=1 Tax=Nocardioides humi TaxID=449461 RepID=UPI00112D12C7|nr:hypothetical protein [Nocardioides humi]
MSRTVLAPLTSVLLLLPLLAGCSADEPGARGDGTPTTAAPSASAVASEEPAPKPLLIGAFRYVSPCRLLGPDDVREIYGKPGPYADITQEGIDSPQPVYPNGREVDSQCWYRFDDKANTSVQLYVDQYPSKRAARKAFASTLRLGRGTLSKQIERDLRKDSPLADVLRGLLEIQKENEAKGGGVRTPAIGEDIAFVSGRGWFEALRGNLVLRLKRSQYQGTPFDAVSIKGTVQQTQEAFRRIDERLADPDLDQTRVDSWWPDTAADGWAPFARVCDVLDDEAMATATGRAVPDTVTDESVVLKPKVRLRRNHLPGSRSVSNRCERRQREPGSDENAMYGDLQIWYTPPGHTGGELLDGAFVRTISGVQAEGDVTIDQWRSQGYLTDIDVKGADKAYTLTSEPDGKHDRWIAAQVGDRVLVLDVSEFGDKSVSVPLGQLLAAMEVAIANLEDATP